MFLQLVPSTLTGWLHFHCIAACLDIPTLHLDHSGRHGLGLPLEEKIACQYLYSMKFKHTNGLKTCISAKDTTQYYYELFVLAFMVKAELTADNTSFLVSPLILTDCTKMIIVANFYSSYSID